MALCSLWTAEVASALLALSSCRDTIDSTVANKYFCRDLNRAACFVAGSLSILLRMVIENEAVLMETNCPL